MGAAKIEIKVSLLFPFMCNNIRKPVPLGAVNPHPAINTSSASTVTVSSQHHRFEGCWTECFMPKHTATPRAFRCWGNSKLKVSVSFQVLEIKIVDQSLAGTSCTECSTSLREITIWIKSPNRWGQQLQGFLDMRRQFFLSPLVTHYWVLGRYFCSVIPHFLAVCLNFYC